MQEWLNINARPNVLAFVLRQHSDIYGNVKPGSQLSEWVVVIDNNWLQEAL